MHPDMPWAVSPEVLAELTRIARGEPSTDFRLRATQLLGFTPSSRAEWLGFMRDDVFAEPLGAVAIEARLGQSGSTVTTGGIAVIPLQGLIRAKPSLFSMLFGGGGSLDSFRSAFRSALSNDDVSAIVINVNSPGGTVDLIPETAAEIRAARGTKPIVALANTDAASAAYWIASQADEVVVTPSGEVGSIGVYMAHEDWSKYDAELGVKTTLISAGRFKTEGNMFEPLSEEAHQAFQEQIDEIYGAFVADVASGRGTTAKRVAGGFGEGRMVRAAKAVELGMADRVDTYEGLIARLAGKPSRRGARATKSDEAPALLTENETQPELAARRALLLARPGHAQPKEG